MNRRESLALCAFFALSNVVNAYAANADAGLYEAAPPADSAFVRVINAKGDGSPVTIDVGGKTYTGVVGTGASVYRPIAAGTIAAKAGKAVAKISIAPGGFYSVVVSGVTGKESIATLSDPLLSTKVQSLLVFYNCTYRPGLDLKLADGKTPVFSNVAAGKLMSRTVNPAKSGFQVFMAGKAVGSVAEQNIERGAAYAILATEVGGKVVLSWIKSETRSK